MFYRRLEFGATVREPSHYLNASRAPMPGVPSFSGVLIAGARTRREAQAGVRSAIRDGLRGSVRLVAARRALDGTVGSPGRRSCYLGGSRGCCATSGGPGWWSVRGGLPLLLTSFWSVASPACLPLFVPGYRNLLSIPLGTTWAP